MVEKILTGLVAAMTAFAVAAETYNGVTYSTSGDIVPGEWTSQFTKAKSYATSKKIPLVVVWANPGCGFCGVLESALAEKKTKTWMATRKYVFVFSLGQDTADGKAAWNYTLVDAYPMCRVYWYRGAAGKTVDEKFCGRTARMNPPELKSGATTSDRFMTLVDSLVGDYVASGDTPAVPADGKYALEVVASGNGTVTGSGSYKAGTRVTLRATAKSGSVFAGWQSASGDLLSQATTYAYVTTNAATTVTGRFILRSEDAVEISCPLAAQYEKGTAIAAVSVVARAQTQTSVSVTGLPTGLSYKNGVISGKPTRSGVYTVKVSARAASGATASLSFSVAVRAANEHFVRATVDAAVGSVSGQGVYAEGKKVTLRFTPKTGNAFVGWYEGGTLRSDARSYSFAMPADDLELTPRCVTAAEDLAAVGLSLDGRAADAAEIVEKSVPCGVTLSWPLAASGLSTVKLSFSGLPSGLSYDAATGLLKGAPTTPRRYSVKVNVKTANGNTKQYRIALTVEARPAWASGTFYGGCEYGGLVGRAVVTVAASGKVSGKLIAAGTTCKLSAASLESGEKRGYSVPIQVTWPSAMLKAGSAGPTSLKLVLSQNGELGRVAGGTKSGLLLDALQSAWERTDLKPPSFPSGAQAPIVALSSGIRLKIGVKGSVLVGGKLGKTSVSSSSQLTAGFDDGTLAALGETVLSLSNRAFTDGYYGAAVGLRLRDGNSDGKIETVEED